MKNIDYTAELIKVMKPAVDPKAVNALAASLVRGKGLVK